MDLLPAHLGDHPFASQLKDSSPHQTNGKVTSQGLQINIHYLSFPPMQMMQIMRVMIHQTWVVQKAKSQLTWSKLNSPLSNLPPGAVTQPQRIQQVEESKGGWIA